jgi:hypothetical protein
VGEGSPLRIDTISPSAKNYRRGGNPLLPSMNAHLDTTRSRTRGKFDAAQMLQLEGTPDGNPHSAREWLDVNVFSDAPARNTAAAGTGVGETIEATTFVTFPLGTV